MLKPLGDRVLVKILEKEEITKGGLIVKEVHADTPQFAEIIEVGNGINDEGKEIKMYVEKKDKVLISKYAGNEIKYEGEDFIILKQSDILAIIK